MLLNYFFHRLTLCVILKTTLMSTFNGIGTKFYGSTDYASDGSYVTTNWFVIFYLPIIPIESLRIIEEGSTNYIIYNSQQYKAIKVKLHKKQVIKTYSWTYGIIGLIVLSAYIFKW